MAIDPWMPNGHGNQTLYKVYVFFYGLRGQEISATKFDVGFRTVELVQDYATSNHSQGINILSINKEQIYHSPNNDLWI